MARGALLDLEPSLLSRDFFAYNEMQGGFFTFLGDLGPRGEVMKVVDPVCKMTIDSEKAAATSEHKGQRIYFCAKGCKAKFDEDPEKYLGK
jgi:Cu+-exporting ATPase